jgi:hypothetical protein
MGRNSRDGFFNGNLSPYIECKGFGLQNLRRPLIAAMMIAVAFFAVSCTRRSASDVMVQFAPLLHMRDQAVANAAAGKTSLDPTSLNQLEICFSDLRSKSDQYTQFIASVVQSSTFNGGQNQADARALELAISSYNDCLLKLQKVAASKSATPPLSLLDADWVPAFGRGVESYWSRDDAMVKLLSPDARAGVVEEIKSETMWPDFAAIGRGSPPPPP